MLTRATRLGGTTCLWSHVWPWCQYRPFSCSAWRTAFYPCPTNLVYMHSKTKTKKGFLWVHINIKHVTSNQTVNATQTICINSRRDHNIKMRYLPVQHALRVDHFRAWFWITQHALYSVDHYLHQVIVDRLLEKSIYAINVYTDIKMNGLCKVHFVENKLANNVQAN